MLKKSILYIIGAGRSGTTLIDMLLGNDKSIFSAGELNRLPKRGGVPPGRVIDDVAYSFWTTISAKLSKQFSLEEVFEMSEKLEYHSSFFGRNRKLPDRYKSYSLELFSIIFEAVEEEIVVDSSKYPMRAYHLANEFPEHFRYCIYVKKHPVAVLRSFQKKGLEQPAKSWLMVNFYLIGVHLLARYMVKKMQLRGVKTMVVKFEDVVNSPLLFVENVEKNFELDLSDLKAKLKSNQPLASNMLFDGNRIRLNKDLSILKNKPPLKWKPTERFVYVCNKFWWKNKD